MKIIQLGAISTGTVIIVGIALVFPAFLQPATQLNILLTFNVVDDSNVPQWCTDLASVLAKHKAKAAVFVTGQVAGRYPQCVSSFSDAIDIGSQTYNYVDLTSIADYTKQLEEVKDGKLAIDKAGNINSRLFRAPYGNTDQNIYSLLSRSGILADFSYDKQYNKFHEGQFIKFAVESFSVIDNPPSFYHNLKSEGNPVVINFDNSVSVDTIDKFLTKLKSNKVRLVSASELVGFDLTVRKGESS